MASYRGYSGSHNHGTVIPREKFLDFQPKWTQRKQDEKKQKNVKTLRPYPGALTGKHPMAIVSPMYDQYIIKPPKLNVTHGRIPDVEFIGSVDRNCTLYPDPANYVMKLKDEYKNVTSVTLFNASIPNTAYLVGTRNNLIYFQETLGTTLIAEVAVGDYSPAGLEAALQTALNNAGESNYTVTLNLLTNSYIFSSDLSGGDNYFNLMFYGKSIPDDINGSKGAFPERTIAPIVGFPCPVDFNFARGLVTVTAGSTLVIGNNGTRFTEDLQVGDTISLPACGTVTTIASITDNFELTLTDPAACSATGTQIAMGVHRAPGKYDLSSEPFIVLNIRELEVVRGNASAVDRSFAVIPMIYPHNTKNFINALNTPAPVYRKYFNPPLPRLDRFTIRFTDYYGNLFNFNGINNFMEFRIMTMNAPGFYDPTSVGP